MKSLMLESRAKNPEFRGSEPQLTLVLALLKVVLGADLRIWIFGDRVFNIKAGGFVLGRSDYQSASYIVSMVSTSL